MSTFNEARDVIFKVFKDVWDTTGYPAVYTDFATAADARGSTPNTNQWARVTIRHADGFQSSLSGPEIGTKKFTNIGVVIIQIFVRIGSGVTAAYDAAQTVATAYRKVTDMPVWFRRVRVREVGSDGAYFQLNVQADFTYDDVR